MWLTSLRLARTFLTRYWKVATVSILLGCIGAYVRRAERDHQDLLIGADRVRVAEANIQPLQARIASLDSAIRAEVTVGTGLRAEIERQKRKLRVAPRPACPPAIGDSLHPTQVTPTDDEDMSELYELIDADSLVDVYERALASKDSVIRLMDKKITAQDVIITQLRAAVSGPVRVPVPTPVRPSAASRVLNGVVYGIAGAAIGRQLHTPSSTALGAGAGALAGVISVSFR